MNTKDVLIAARELISDPKRWTQFVYARNEEGRACPPTRQDAVGFCASGAVGHVLSLPMNLAEASPAIKALQIAAAILHSNTSIPSVNDCFGHQAVLGIFDKAIKDCP